MLVYRTPWADNTPSLSQTTPRVHKTLLPSNVHAHLNWGKTDLLSVYMGFTPG